VPRLPQATGAELVRALGRAGFVVTRRRGSHVQLRRELPDGTVTTFPVPVHAGRTIKKGTLRGILRKAGLSPEDLAALM
jgi:predicted RNA binding protein YcfA (HicA-like mRNA interferase family)